MHLRGFLAALLLVISVVALSQDADSGAVALDVVLVVDNSDSMSQSDPGGMVRDMALDLMVRLPSGSRLALVIFDEEAAVAVGMVEVSSVAAVEQMAQGLDAVSYSGRHASIAHGVRAAIQELAEGTRTESIQGIVLVTDGGTDSAGPSSDSDGEWALTESAARECLDRGIRVFSISFPGDLDFALARHVAELTGGTFSLLDDVSGSGEVLASIVGKMSQTPPEASPETQPDAADVAAREDAGREFDYRLWVVPTASLIILIWFFAYQRWKRPRTPVLPPRRPRPGVKSKPQDPDVPRAHLHDVAGVALRKPYLLRSAQTRIGREPDNDLVIPEKTVSGAHARIDHDEGSFAILDLDSSNGTKLNGDRLRPHQPRRLASGDRITFDLFDFVFKLEEEVPAEPEPEPEPEAEADSESEAEAEAETEKEAEPEPESIPEGEEDDSLPTTRLKPATCPVHPGERATELCSECKNAFCAQCVSESDGRVVCSLCQETATVAKPSGCPNHPEVRATELCPACKQPFCAECVVEQDGATVCLSCAQVPPTI